MESDARFFRRRANEEMAAAGRAVTEAAKERRLILAQAFLDRLKELEARTSAMELEAALACERPVFEWKGESAARHASQ